MSLNLYQGSYIDSNRKQSWKNFMQNQEGAIDMSLRILSWFILNSLEISIKWKHFHENHLVEVIF